MPGGLPPLDQDTLIDVVFTELNAGEYGAGAKARVAVEPKAT